MNMRSAALAACLAAAASCSPAPPAAGVYVPDGARIYAAKCAACHQPDGGGIPGICPPLSSSPRLAGRAEDTVRVMLLGMKGPITRNGISYNGVMPAWRFDLGDAQIAAVINEIRARWRPGSPEATEEMVRRVRAETSGHKLFPSPQELGLAE
jgi:mono/diheme cytochrome c family protein